MCLTRTKFSVLNTTIMTIISLTSLVATIVTGAKNMGIWYYISLFILIISLGGYCVYALTYAYRNRGVFSRFIAYSLLKKEPYIVLKRESLYEFVDRENMKHKKEITVQSTTKRLHEFTDRYKWSKEGPCDIVVLQTDQKVIRQFKDIHWNYYTIALDRYYNKGENSVTGIEMPSLKDEKRESELFLSSGVFEPTRELHLKVCAHQPLKFVSAKVKVFRTYFDLVAFDTNDLEPEYNDNCSVLSFTWKYPLMGAKYMIEWAFEDEGCG